MASMVIDAQSIERIRAWELLATAPNLLGQLISDIASIAVPHATVEIRELRIVTESPSGPFGPPNFNVWGGQIWR